MKKAKNNNFDFDSMSLIAKEDPEKFERIRQLAIDEYIESVPQERQHRLRCLQWRIDQERRNCTPLSACLKISKMMWDHLIDSGILSGQQNHLLFANSRIEHAPAKIINFPDNHGQR